MKAITPDQSVPLYEARIAKAKEFADYWSKEAEEHSDPLSRSASNSATAVLREMESKLQQIRDFNRDEDDLETSPQDRVEDAAYFATQASPEVLNDTPPHDEVAADAKERTAEDNEKAKDANRQKAAPIKSAFHSDAEIAKAKEQGSAPVSKEVKEDTAPKPEAKAVSKETAKVQTKKG